MKNVMRPCTILQVVSGDLWAGAEMQVLLQSRALRDVGWDVRVLTFNRAEAFANYEAASIPCRCAAERRGFFALLLDAVREVSALAPALLIAHGYKESCVAFLVHSWLRIPWIATFHGAAEIGTGTAGLKSRLYAVLYRTLAVVSAARVVVVSSAVATAWRFQKLKKLRRVHNVADVACLSSSAANAVGECAQGARPVVVCVGRLAPVKHFDLAIRAVSELKVGESQLEVMLCVIGDGPERESLERLARELRCEQLVTFLGFRRCAGALLSEADVLLITSRSEGLPTVLLEGLLAGIPIVSTDVGGIREVLDLFPDYSAVLVPPDDLNAVTAALRDMLLRAQKPADRARLEHVFGQNFSPQAAAGRLVDVFAEVVPPAGRQ